MKSIRMIEMDENAVEPADAVCRPGPDEHSRVGVTEIDVDGYVDRKNDVKYIGIARKQPDGTWRAVAIVNGALCIVEATVTFSKNA